MAADRESLRRAIDDSETLLERVRALVDDLGVVAQELRRSAAAQQSPRAEPDGAR